MEPVPSEIVRSYPKRGPLQQHRFSHATAFRCIRCGQSKKSKLITVYYEDWGRRLCNGCYGKLLSIYNVRAGVNENDEKAEMLSAQLEVLVSEAERLEAERLLRISNQQKSYLSAASVRFIATSNYLAGKLREQASLEWSPAIIGLCKALELEIVRLLLEPLKRQLKSSDLKDDLTDKDFQRIARFCSHPDTKQPELGAFAHFLQTVIHSKQRRTTSPLAGTFLSMVANMTDSNWLLSSDGLHQLLSQIIVQFRNRAAHIEEMNSSDYERCYYLVVGEQGLLWHLVAATTQHS